MDIVSFETALKLKEAGLPQPELEAGHAIYIDENLCFITFAAVPRPDNESAEFQFVRRADDDVRWNDDYEYIFAPTATDILRELDSVRLYFDKVWYIDWFRYNTVETFSHENPAEDCAMAYLARRT